MKSGEDIICGDERLLVGCKCCCCCWVAFPKPIGEQQRKEWIGVLHSTILSEEEVQAHVQACSREYRAREDVGMGAYV